MGAYEPFLKWLWAVFNLITFIRGGNAVLNF